MAATKSTVREVSTQQVPAQKTEKDRAGRSQGVATQGKHRISLDYGSFEYAGGDFLDLEKAVLSVAFLLEWGSDVGNRDFDGTASNGLARILRYQIAEEIERLRNRSEI